MEKKVILFDLDETLRSLEIDKSGEHVIKVRLRPNIKALLEKLKEVKEQGTDIMICTTALSESAQKHFIDYLPEEYRDLFCRVISRDNKLECEKGSKEEEVYRCAPYGKPVTALKEYDQILFFDDNRGESFLLEDLYKNEEDSPNKQVIFARYLYNAQYAHRLYAYKKMSEENNEVAEKVNMFFSKLLEDPGCALMIEKIDEFQKLEFAKGLTLDMENKKMRSYFDELSDIEDEIYDLIYRNDELEKKYDGFIEEYFSLIDFKKNKKDDDVREK